MTARTIPDAIQRLLEERGIAEYGTGQVPETLRLFPQLPYVLSFMVPLPRAVVGSIQGGPNQLYFHHYRTINTYLDSTAMAVELAFRGMDHDAVYIPASQSTSGDGLRGDFSHKMAANLCGLGSIGRNCLFLSRKYGSAVRLSTVFTNMALPERTEVAEQLCIGCNRCMEGCPSGALYGVDFSPDLQREDMMDAKKCSVHMKTQYAHIGRGAVCGLCFSKCPLSNI